MCQSLPEADHTQWWHPGVGDWSHRGWGSCNGSIQTSKHAASGHCPVRNVSVRLRGEWFSPNDQRVHGRVGVRDAPPVPRESLLIVQQWTRGFIAWSPNLQIGSALKTQSMENGLYALFSLLQPEAEHQHTQGVVQGLWMQTGWEHRSW